MDDTQCDHLHKNTATCMNVGVSQAVRTKCLAQVYNISAKYIGGITSHLTEKRVSTEEVQGLSKQAAMMRNVQKYMPKESALHVLMGRDVPIDKAPFPGQGPTYPQR